MIACKGEASFLLCLSTLFFFVMYVEDEKKKNKTRDLTDHITDGRA